MTADTSKEALEDLRHAYKSAEPDQPYIPYFKAAIDTITALLAENEALKDQVSRALDGWSASQDKHIAASDRATDAESALATLEPNPAAQDRDALIAATLELAAGVLDKRAHDYHQEHGMYDHSTGQVEYPGTGDEWMAEWEEIAEEIRAIATQLQTAAQKKAEP